MYRVFRLKKWNAHYDIKGSTGKKPYHCERGTSETTSSPMYNRIALAPCIAKRLLHRYAHRNDKFYNPLPSVWWQRNAGNTSGSGGSITARRLNTPPNY
jgi:hypothetical protein